MRSVTLAFIRPRWPLLAHFHHFPVGDLQGLRFLPVDPQDVFRHLLRQQGIVDRVPLGVYRAAPEGQAELPRTRHGRRFVGQQRRHPGIFPAIVDDLDLSRKGF